GGAWKVSVANPDATTLVSSLTVGTSGAFVDTKTLAQTGTYTISLNPQSSATGTMTVTVYDVPADATGTITPGGAPVSATVTTPGQNASLTFAGTAGQRISLKLGNVTIGSSAISGTSVSILNPDATTLASVVVGTSGGFLDTKTLPQTGTYTIRIDPQGANTGSITLTLYNVPADATGTITVGGAAVTVTTTAPGQNASLTFAGTAGRRISMSVAQSNCCGANISIKNPDGSSLLSPTLVGVSGGFIDTKT